MRNPEIERNTEEKWAKMTRDVARWYSIGLFEAILVQNIEYIDRLNLGKPDKRDFTVVLSFVIGAIQKMIEQNNDSVTTKELLEYKKEFESQLEELSEAKTYFLQRKEAVMDDLDERRITNFGGFIRPVTMQDYGDLAFSLTHEESVKHRILQLRAQLQRENQLGVDTSDIVKQLLRQTDILPKIENRTESKKEVVWWQKHKDSLMQRLIRMEIALDDVANPDAIPVLKAEIKKLHSLITHAEKQLKHLKTKIV